MLNFTFYNIRINGNPIWVIFSASYNNDSNTICYNKCNTWRYFLGYSLSLMSLLGIVTLYGVVVNDSLIMVYSINESEERDLHKKIIDVAKTRFRPVILTTITTFLGLLPLILEKIFKQNF